MKNKNSFISQKISKNLLSCSSEDQKCFLIFQTGIEKHRQGKVKEAISIYQQILSRDANYFDALHMIGLAYKQLGMSEQALGFFEKAISVRPLDPSLQSNYGNLLLNLQRYDEAIYAYELAIEKRSDFADAHYNKGIALDALKCHELAINSYSSAIELNDKKPEYFLCRANACQMLERYEQSILDYQEVLNIRPNDYLALINAGLACYKSKRLERSLEFLNLAEELEQKDSKLFYYKGNALREAKRAKEAIKCYMRAIELSPEVAKYYLDLGNSYMDTGSIQDAIKCYQLALNLDPMFPFLLGQVVHVKCQLADWDGLEETLKLLQDGVLSGNKLAAPFPLLALIDDQMLARAASQIFCKDQIKQIEGSLKQIDHNFNDLKNLPDADDQNQKIQFSTKRTKKLRIGYYSSDFYQHATAYLIAQLFEQHDKNQFEIVGFSFSGSKHDDMSVRIEKAFDHYYDVNDLTDLEVAQLSRNIGIDIAVDLKGYTQNCRSLIFAYRCAPVQVSYLGYPGTMSAHHMDFIVADKTVIPDGQRDNFSEQIAYLPHCYQVNDSKRAIASSRSTRAENGLPEDVFVFCCFNNTYKIQPPTFALWMRILKRVPNSVLWLIKDNEQAESNLKAQAVLRGVDSSRLVFAKRMGLPSHLERHRHAHLFLDTLPYNAHTTASDALWSGLLVLTLMGNSFASRVCASLLGELNLNNFICTTEHEYEEQAVFWAENLDQLNIQKMRLLQEIGSSTLFRGDLFARSLEEVYKRMFKQFENGGGFSSFELI
jgi:predicted O-linked N-acetylglucosamine transferase (SPINDLY family)